MTVNSPAKQKHVLQWHLTHRCNLRCTHCYQDDYSTEMPQEEVRRILLSYRDYCKKKGFRGHINFTGGEPFIRKDFPEILNLCEKEEISFGILTNATLIDPDTADMLKSFRHLSFVQTSIDGTPGVHDNIRGKGTYRKSMAGMKLLKERDIQTMISFTCHADNYKSLRSVIRRMERAGMDRFWTDRLIPFDEENRARVLSTEQYRAFLDVLRAERDRAEKKASCTTKIECRRALQFYCGENTVYRCSAGEQLLVLLSDGTLLPCRWLPLPIGNIRSMSFEDTETTEVITALRAHPVPSKCYSCGYADLCAGGARCLTYALTGSLVDPDVNCMWLHEPIL